MSDGQQYHFGWKPDQPDPRDYLFALPQTISDQVPLPPSVDLREGGYLPPVYDQGNLGSCVAHASCAALEYSERKLGEPDVERSRLELYYYARQLEGAVGEDSGCTIRDAFKAMNGWGVAPESEWPYDISQFTVAPTPRVVAQNQKLVEYKRIPAVRAGEGVRLALSQGLPVVFGIKVYSSFMGEQAQETGVIPVPNLHRETFEGGHAILAVGYSDPDKWVICRNSWGGAWGDKGYFYLPTSYAFNTRLASDFWVVNKY